MPKFGEPDSNQAETVDLVEQTDADKEAELAELAALSAIERRRQLVDAHNARQSR